MNLTKSYSIGQISSASTQCPNSLLGTFSYTYDSGSGNACTGDSSLDVCSSNSQLLFNYTQCSTEQGYSGN